MHQGWPKFASHLWMKTPDDGLAAVAYAPCEVETEIKDQPICIEVRTDYPFEDTIRFTVRTKEAVRFPLRLRIPAWAEYAEIRVGDAAPIRANGGMFHTIERDWEGNTPVTLQLPMRVRTQMRYNGAVSRERGPRVLGK